MEEGLRISSPAFVHNGVISPKYTADGENISPPLVIEGVSPETKSLVLIVDDPDAATDPHGPGKVFDHWVVFNISPTTTEIVENSVPSGAVQGKNGTGGNTYIGPAPPTGVHRYFFRLYELRGTLSLNESATKEAVQTALQPLLISQAELVGTYQRASS